LLLTNFVARLGNPFTIALACFTMRGLAWRRFATTASAVPVFLVAFAATFLTDFVEMTVRFGFELMP